MAKTLEFPALGLFYDLFMPFIQYDNLHKQGG